MECAPTISDEVANVATPLLSVLVAIATPPSLNVTVPVGVPAVAVVVAVKVTVSPYVDGFNDEVRVMVIFALFTENVCAFEVPPPGVGLNTVINAVSVAVSISLGGNVACTEVADTNVVVLFDPFRRTTDCVLKPVPTTVRVVVASPTNVLVGEMKLVVGDGFNTVNVNAFDAPPPGVGLVAVIKDVVASEKSDVVKNTDTCVELANTVVRALPFQLIAVAPANPVPVTVTIAPEAPAIAVLGIILSNVGAR